jgi:ribosomal protein S18 acetylase RimI-like enzyme
MTVEKFSFKDKDEKTQLIISQILYKAFETKFTPILKKVSTAEALEIIKQTLLPTSGLLGREGSKIIGVAILSSKKAPSLNIDKSLIKKIGYIPYKYFKYVFHVETINDDQTIKIELLAINKKVRGKGFGSKLLTEIIKYSRQEKYKKILLDVVDTNPRAKMLYKRIGFKTTNKHYSGVLTKAFGYSYEEEMSLNINKKYKSIPI